MKLFSSDAEGFSFLNEDPADHFGKILLEFLFEEIMNQST